MSKSREFWIHGSLADSTPPPKEDERAWIHVREVTPHDEAKDRALALLREIRENPDDIIKHHEKAANFLDRVCVLLNAVGNSEGASSGD